MLESLSIVYPMYNEKDNIETAVSEALRIGYQMAPLVEVVVVDDASTDGCGEIADRLAREHPEVQIVHHPCNRKLGGALRSGFAAARHAWILYMDSDLPIKMDDALQALPLAENADIVIAWRISRAESKRREVMSWVYNRLIRWGMGLRVRDVNFAFKLFKRSYYQKIRFCARKVRSLTPNCCWKCSASERVWPKCRYTIIRASRAFPRFRAGA